MGGLARYHHLVALAVILAGTVAVQGPTIRKTFHQRFWEDGLFIEVARQYIHSFVNCFTAPSLHAGLYRPLSTHCYYYLTQNVLGLDVEYLKVISIAFYVANAFLFFLICKQLMGWKWALIPVVLCVTRRSDYDLVSLTVEYQTLLSVFYGLLAVYSFVRARSGGGRAWEYASYVFFVLSLFSKETALAMAGVVVVYGLLFDERGVYRPYAVYALISSLWTVLLFAVFRGLRDYEPTGFLYTFWPAEVARNYVGHALDFFNPLLPAMDKEGLPFGDRILSMSMSTIARALFAGLVAIEVVLVARSRSISGRYGDSLRRIAFGVAFFLLAMAPYAILKNRLYLRYSYVGHFGLAFAFGETVRVGVEWAKRRLARRS